MQILWTIHVSSKSSYSEQIKSLKKNARWNEIIVIQLKQIQFIQFHMFFEFKVMLIFISLVLFYFILILIFDLVFKKKI